MEIKNFHNVSSNSIAILAGSGELPYYVTKSIVEQGEFPILFLLEGNADVALRNYVIQLDIPYVDLTIYDFSKLIRALKFCYVKKLVLAGGIKSRPDIKSLTFDMHNLYAIFRMLTALKRGDDFLLKKFIKLIESYGINVIGAQKVSPDLLSPTESVLTNKKPSNCDIKDISLAIDFLAMVSPMDIGQAAVVTYNRVVALEGPEGTDNMLSRVALMRDMKKIPSNGGVLVKVTKLNQEERVDLPTIGVDTIENVYKAGLNGIAIEANKSFIIDKDNVVRLANRYGLFIVTLDMKRDKNTDV